MHTVLYELFELLYSISDDTVLYTVVNNGLIRMRAVNWDGASLHLQLYTTNTCNSCKLTLDAQQYSCGSMHCMLHRAQRTSHSVLGYRRIDTMVAKTPLPRSHVSSLIS